MTLAAWTPGRYAARAVAAFHKRVREVCTEAAATFRDLSKRLRAGGLDSDASLADVMATRMERTTELDPDGDEFFNDVANASGITARGVKALAEVARVELGVDLEPTRDALSRLSHDCLVETQPVTPPPPFGSWGDGTA